MNIFRDKKTKIIALSGLLLAIFAVVWFVVASESDGTIDSEIKYAWNENAGWINFGDENGNVEITDLELSGYAWSENLGWISLNCSNNDVCETSDYKVSNDAEGNLSGYAWSESSGWINFSPADGGVQIDSSGIFSGYAWGENIGWIVFNCEDLDVCNSASFKVKTDWRPLSARESDDSDDDEDEDDLEISDVHYSSTDTTIVVKWETNRDADGSIRWGPDKNNLNERKEENDEKGEDHKITIRELQPSTEYYFRVKSADGGDSDTSRTYSTSTKAPSVLFARRVWQSLPEKSAKQEQVGIEVRDEREEDLPEEIIPGEPGKGILASLKEKLAGVISGFYGGLKKIAWKAYDVILAGQKKIAEAFGAAKNWLALLYNSIKQEKGDEVKIADEAARKIDRFFTARVFRENSLKRISEVRFQIMDRRNNAIPDLETKLFSDPQAAVTDKNGIALFRDVAIGTHTLVFSHQGEDFKKRVAIADTLTEEGPVRMEIVRVKAEKEKLAWWMQAIILIMLSALAAAFYFALKYYKLKNKIFS